MRAAEEEEQQRFEQQQQQQQLQEQQESSWSNGSHYVASSNSANGDRFRELERETSSSKRENEVLQSKVLKELPLIPIFFVVMLGSSSFVSSCPSS